jgi:hypothetical protein
MSPDVILAYAPALLIGVLLGIVGGGGSILTMPALVYGFHLPPFTAATYSLFIVGASSAVGAARYARQGLVDYRAAARFALPAFVAIYAVRGWVLPALPASFPLPGGFALTKDQVLMLLLAAAMLASARGMLKRRPAAPPAEDQPRSALGSVIRGFAVGIFTGFVGAGGGFLLVPALALVERLPMKKAVATSLFVIAVNGLFGFAGDALTTRSIDWVLLAGFTALAALGIVVGVRVARSLSERQARVFFGWLVVALAVIIVAKEIWS